jgi:HSP20 family protein
MNMKEKMKRKSKDPAMDVFDKDFVKIQEEMERMVNDILTLHFRHEGLAKKHSPFVYGFSMKVSPGGKPEIHEFGTALPPQKEWKEKQEIEISREPMIDLIEGHEEVSVIAELPGAQKEDVHISCTDDTMLLTARYHDKNYKKEIFFPCKVKGETAHATYKNGVLEVKFKRQELKKEHGKNVKIEG